MGRNIQCLPPTRNNVHNMEGLEPRLGDEGGSESDGERESIHVYPLKVENGQTFLFGGDQDKL